MIRHETSNNARNTRAERGRSANGDRDSGHLDVDNLPEPDTRPTVWIERIDTDVANVAFQNGCTMADLIAAASANARNHGQFVRAVAHMTGEWRELNLIDGRERAMLVAAAAISNRD